MTTRTLARPIAGTSWAPALFKVTAALTFALGFAIHTTRLMIGVDRLVRDFVTPSFDVAFSILMLVAAIAGVVSWRRYTGGRAGRIIFGFMLVVLIGSLPLHFRTWVSWSTDFLKVFPVWYSAAEVPMFAALAWMAARLKFDTD